MSQAERDNPNGIAVVEAALLLEAGAGKDFDKVIVVTCDFDCKVTRYSLRAGVSIDAARIEVERRSAAQLSDQEKASRADYVIENSGDLEDLELKVEDLWKKLLSESRP